jgi:hypothetical protein
MSRKQLHSPDAEAALVGAALMEPAVFSTVKVSPSDFHDEGLASVWRAGQSGGAVDRVTLSERAGVPLSLLVRLENECPNFLHADEYAQTVRDLAWQRRLSELGQQVFQAAYKSNGTLQTDAAKLVGQLVQLVDGSAATGERYALCWADEALKPQPPVDWVIEQLFSSGTVNLVYGEPGTKKTWAMLDAATCVALGQPWLDMPTNQGVVLLVDEESGSRRLARRLGDVLRGHNAGQETPIAWVSLACFNFLQAEDLLRLKRMIAESGARLVVIDALADVMLGGDENTVKDTEPVFHGLRTVACATGAAIVVIHHSNRAGRYRGSSAILGVVDLALEVSSKPDSPNVDFETVKVRDGEPLKFAAAAHFSDGLFRMTPTITRTPGEILSKGERYVLGYLQEHGGQATKTEIEQHADSCSMGSARNAIYALVERHRIRRCDSGGNGSKATFALIVSDE